MLVTATSEVVRVMGVWVRRADAGLADRAVRNAAAGVTDRSSRRMEDARTMRDLRRLRPPTPANATSAPVESSQHDSADGSVGAVTRRH
jgi:hypothetical protein